MVHADVIVVEISTSQREKCLAMLLKQWKMSSVRALRAPRASLTLPSAPVECKALRPKPGD